MAGVECSFRVWRRREPVRVSRSGLFSVLPVLVAVVCIGLGGRAGATSWIPPRSLAELALQGDAVVLAEAGGATAESRGSLVFTTTQFTVLESLSGPVAPGETVDVQVPGGRIADRVVIVAGSPRFEVGKSYLLSLQQKTSGLWLPLMLSWGILREESGHDGIGLLVPLAEVAEARVVDRPDGESVEPLVTCYRDPLLVHLRDVLSGSGRWDLGGVRADPEQVAPSRGEDERGGGGSVPGGCFYFNSNGTNWRWPRFDRGDSLRIHASSNGDPTRADGGFHLIQEGLDLWMGVSGTGVNLLFGGTASGGINCGGTANVVMFDDPCSDIADLQNCGGVLAFGGGSAAGTHSFDGTTWISMATWFVVLNNGICVGDGGYRILLAHELGHGLGFGHAQDSGALMWGTCCNAINSTDRTCVRYTYPASDPQNARPQVDAGPDRTLSLLGDSARLVGSVTDDGRPGGAVATRWVQLVGPGEAVFEDRNALDTVVTFSQSGTYLLGLEADDGELVRMAQTRLRVVTFSGGPGVLSFQQGVDGYSSTVDTALLESDPTASGWDFVELSVDADDPGGTGLATQTLLRFDRIFGDEAGQIPAGAPIQHARLELTSTNPGDGAVLYRFRQAWSGLESWSTFGGDGIQTGVEVAVDPDAAVVGASGGPVAVDVTSSLAVWSSDPCSNYGWAFLPRGGDGWDFFSAEGDEPPRLVVETANPGRQVLVALGDAWSYFKGTTAPPPDWRDLEFSAGPGWLSGPTGIGYGDEDDATVLGDMENGYEAVFLRREFEVWGPITDLRLSIDYDDGFVAYLNGVEVARSDSMGDTPGAPVGYRALAASHEAGRFEEFVLDTSPLRRGANVLAVEVHNTARGSSDLSFRPELFASSLLVGASEEWAFWRGSVPPPDGWETPELDDGAWERGRTGIGYGDGDDLTLLEDMPGNYTSVFCRREFSVEDLGSIDGVVLDLLYDDGVVVYVNGAEVDRINMPSGAVTEQTRAAGAIEPSFARVPLPSGMLVQGRNVLAVSVHNAALDSSDLTFDPIVASGVTGGVVDCSARFRRGDANNDGSVDVSDAITLLLHLFGGGGEPACQDAADVDDDAELTVTDAVDLLATLILGAAEPPAPGFRCGSDRTNDSLPACGTVGCEP